MTTAIQAKTVEQAARSRVSKRKYTDVPLTKEEITELIEIAGKAPSSANVQPWRYIVVVDEDVKKRLQEAAYNQAQVGAAKALIVVTSDMEDVIQNAIKVQHPNMTPEDRQQRAERLVAMHSKKSVKDRGVWGAGQTYISLGYLLLALESKGYASSPMLGFEPDKVREILGLADYVEIPALVAIGWPAEEGFPQFRHPVEDILRFV